MQTAHTPQQWRDLHAQITALIADPTTTFERRSRAQEVMNIIRRTPEAMIALQEPTPVRLTDQDWTDEYL